MKHVRGVQMKWITLFDHELMSIRLDQEDNSLLLEVNDGGISPEYVTVRLGIDEASQLEDVLKDYRNRISTVTGKQTGNGLKSD